MTKPAINYEHARVEDSWKPVLDSQRRDPDARSKGGRVRRKVGGKPRVNIQLAQVVKYWIGADELSSKRA